MFSVGMNFSWFPTVSLRLRMTWRLEVLCLLVLGYVGELATEDTIASMMAQTPPHVRNTFVFMY